MEDLLADFVAEAREMHDALASEIVAWEAQPADLGRLDAIFRFFHTVKGNCGFFDFPQLERLAHAAEDALSDVRSGTKVADQKLVDLVLAALDRIIEMIAIIEARGALPVDDDEAMISSLSGSQEPGLTGPTPDGVARPETADRQSAGQRTIRLPVDLLDRILSGVSDMALVRNDLARRIENMGGESGLEAPFGRLSAALNDVREAITRSRMQRIETVFAALPRLVRDLSTELGRQVMLELENGDVELDRELVELVRDPLVHVIRNAIDHGIETPAERRAAGKREIGLISISARQTGNEIRIGIIDDGRGVDDERLVKKAIASGLITEEQAAKMPREARFKLMCEPGISTADKVSAVSGRGVGMDVVNANIERIGGSIGINSTRGQGTRILLNIPLTLSVVPSITLGCGRQKFAMPRSYVEEIVRGADNAKVSRVGDGSIITLRGKRLPCVSLARVLELDNGDPADDCMVVVIRLVGGNLFALAVDEIFDHSELVIKPVAPALTRTGFYVGAAQLDDGTPVLMLDVSGIARVSGLLTEVRREVTIDQRAPGTGVREVAALIFENFEGRRQAVPMQAIDRVEWAQPGAIRRSDEGDHLVANGRLLPLLGLADASLPEEGLEILCLSDGSREIAYAIRDVAQVVKLDGETSPVSSARPVSGVTMIAGEPVEVLDCHGLFSLVPHVDTVISPPVCRMPTADKWFDTFLRPIVEAAGYRVVGEDDDTHADVTILPEEAASIAAAPGSAIVLRASPEAAPDSAKSIYRYDREALLEALRHAAREHAA